MADAIPTPPEKQAPVQSTVLIQPPLSQWEALKQAGWWRPFDWAMLALISAVWLTGFYWKVFGNPGIEGFIALLLVNISLLLVWIISLVFRCSWFVLRLNADIATLPTDAARIAVAYLSGQTPPPPPKK
jgi:hypothetical protein